MLKRLDSLVSSPVFMVVLIGTVLLACKEMETVSGSSGNSGSPWVTHLDANVNTRLPLESLRPLSVRPVVGFAHSVGGGVEGETLQILYVGTQIRRPLHRSDALRGWIGAEVDYARRRMTFDIDEFDPEWSNGLIVSALGGIPVHDGSRFSLDVVGGGGVAMYGGSGPYARLGLSFRKSIRR